MRADASLSSESLISSVNSAVPCRWVIVAVEAGAFRTGLVAPAAMMRMSRAFSSAVFVDQFVMSSGDSG